MPRHATRTSFKPGHKVTRRGAPNRATYDVREWARGLLDDPQYQASLLARLRKGTAGQVEVLLYHYANGKPRELVEQRIVGMTTEQAAEGAERFRAQLARLTDAELRAAEAIASKMRGESGDGTC